MNNYKYQQGLGAIGWLCVIFLVVFFGICAAKMVPVYKDNLMIKTALRNLAEGPENVHEMDAGQIRQKLTKFYTINGVDGVATDSLDIDRRQDKTLVTIKYEKRVPLFANISVVMAFNNVLNSSRPEACCSAP